jgi:hypothetical protein
MTPRVLLAPTLLRVDEIAERLRSEGPCDVPAATELGIVVAYGAVPENTMGVAEAVARGTLRTSMGAR